MCVYPNQEPCKAPSLPGGVSIPAWAAPPTPQGKWEELEAGPAPTHSPVQEIPPATTLTALCHLQPSCGLSNDLSFPSGQALLWGKTGQDLFLLPKTHLLLAAFPHTFGAKVLQHLQPATHWSPPARSQVSCPHLSATTALLCTTPFRDPASQTGHSHSQQDRPERATMPVLPNDHRSQCVPASEHLSEGQGCCTDNFLDG